MGFAELQLAVFHHSTVLTRMV